MQARGSQHIRGIDVSKWQGTIDWDKVKADGIQFVIIKATEGTSYVDPNFKKNVEGARRAGLVIGAYHYAHPDNNPQKEVEFFIKTTANISLDLPPVLDLEVNKGLNKAAVTQFAVQWLTAMEERIGRRPIFYSYTSFIRDYIGTQLAAWPLWIAHYEVLQPSSNGVWSRWDIFQYSSKGRVAGIHGNVDLNVMEQQFFARMGAQPPDSNEQEEYRMSVEDANKIIRFLSAAYFAMEGNKEAQQEFHRLANELRKASGQQI